MRESDTAYFLYDGNEGTTGTNSRTELNGTELNGVELNGTA
jgi:hypothetical protein